MKSRWMIGSIILFSAMGGWIAPVWKGKQEIAITLFAVPFLFLGSLPVLVTSIRQWGWRRTLSVWGTLSLFAYLIEIIGVQTGFPYGQFHYAFGTGPFVLGVPIWLPLAWVPLILGAWYTVGRFSSPGYQRIFLTAGLLILVDLVLDPGAVALGLWKYKAIQEGTNLHYYFVPLSNFLGWLLSGCLGALLLQRLNVSPKGSLFAWLFPLLTGLGFWTGVVLRAWFVIPIVLGIGLTTGLFYYASRDEQRVL